MQQFYTNKCLYISIKRNIIVNTNTKYKKRSCQEFWILGSFYGSLNMFVIIKDNKSFTKLVDKVADFCVNYDSNNEYKQFVQNGTGSKENVRGERFQHTVIM